MRNNLLIQGDGCISKISCKLNNRNSVFNVFYANEQAGLRLFCSHTKKKDFLTTWPNCLYIKIAKSNERIIDTRNAPAEYLLD